MAPPYNFETTAEEHQPKLLILAGRDASTVRKTAEAISNAWPGVKTRVLELDLSSQTQVRKAADEIDEHEERWIMRAKAVF
ncbi:hypothetical protein LTR66_001494 [Elasticomyces elasticus]|nr:hypothetical protein LTR66_001494 [Elasticomyces elasticus]